MSNRNLPSLTAAPRDPIARIHWLTAWKEEMETQLLDAYANAYFEARKQGRIEEALAKGPHSRKQTLALTRRENERRGRQIRWGDGIDQTSTACSSRR